MTETGEAERKQVQVQVTLAYSCATSSLDTVGLRRRMPKLIYNFSNGILAELSALSRFHGLGCALSALVSFY